MLAPRLSESDLKEMEEYTAHKINNMQDDPYDQFIND